MFSEYRRSGKDERFRYVFGKKRERHIVPSLTVSELDADGVLKACSIALKKRK